LAVLVDRGQRELPVQADLVVARCSVPSTQSLELSQTDGGRLTFGIETAG
jgi:pyrimidine operon attenuation protein/uracil phosphoribosyltransferase